MEPIGIAPWATIAFHTEEAVAGDINNEKPSSEMIFPTPIVTGCPSTCKIAKMSDRVYSQQYSTDHI